jgi:hypothetical protein
MSPEAFNPARETGTGVLVGPGVAEVLAEAPGLAIGEALAEALELGEAPALEDGEALDDGVGDGLGDGDGVGVGEGDGVGVGASEGLGDGVWPTGVGVAARFSPTRSCPRPVASKCTVVTWFFIASTELVRIWCASVSGADDPQPATSGAASNRPPNTTKSGVRRNTKILLALYRSETLSPGGKSRTPPALKAGAAAPPEKAGFAE